MHLQILCGVQPLASDNIAWKEEERCPGWRRREHGDVVSFVPWSCTLSPDGVFKGTEACWAALFETQTDDSFCNLERAILSGSPLTGKRRSKLTPRGERGLMGDGEGCSTISPQTFLFSCWRLLEFISGHFAPSLWDQVMMSSGVIGSSGDLQREAVVRSCSYISHKNAQRGSL